MSWLKRKENANTQDSRTIDLRKRRSLFGSKKSRSKKPSETESTDECALCHKTIKGEPILCNQYLTRSKLCSAGPFCSDDCWEKHMSRVSHY